MDKNHFSRRIFISGLLKKGSLFLGGIVFLQSCGSDGQKPGDEADTNTGSARGDDCDDLSGIAEGELKKRESLGYVKKTPNPETYCGNCSLFIPPNGDQQCGGCLLFDGPVQYNGHCVQWAGIAESS